MALEKTEELIHKICWAFNYRNKSENLGRKRMCKNCIYFACHFNWIGNWYFCMADNHQPKSRRQRCTNDCFESILDCKELTDENIQKYQSPPKNI